MSLLTYRTYVRSSEKFYKEIMGAQHFSFYIVLSNYVWSILFCRNKDHNVRQIRFRVCIKVRRCKRFVCKGKTLSGQPNIRTRQIRIWSQCCQWDPTVNLPVAEHVWNGKKLKKKKNVQNIDRTALRIRRRISFALGTSYIGKNSWGFARWFCYHFSLADGIDKRRVM